MLSSCVKEQKYSEVFFDTNPFVKIKFGSGFGEENYYNAFCDADPFKCFKIGMGVKEQNDYKTGKLGKLEKSVESECQKFLINQEIQKF